MNKLLSLTGLALASILIASCSTDKDFENRLKSTLKNNPDIVFDAIKENPDQFMQTFQTTVEVAKENFAKNAQAREEEKLAEAFKNPLKPYISDTQIIKGPKDAPITLIEYSDFECPYCARGQKTVEQLMKKYPGKIRFVFKHLPLSFHPHAMISAKYYEAIGLQSPKKAFAFHNKLFSNQKKLNQGETYLTQIAKEVGADMARLKKDVHSVKVRAKIDEDIQEANKFSFQGTPGYIINGIPVKGAYPASHFEKIIATLQEKGTLQL